MKTDRRTSSSQSGRPALPIAIENYPALRSFLRGYFHQDMKDEYGSAEEAVREFCQDASAEERAEVASEWSRFVAATQGQLLEQINKALTGVLGSSYRLSAEDIQRISAVLAAGDRKRKS